MALRSIVSSTWVHRDLLLIPKSGLTPRSQPMSSYLLYSSLVFCHSQAPIFVTAKCLTQLRFPSFLCLAEKLTIPASQMPFPRTVMRRPCLIFQPPVILMTGSQVYWKGHSPSTVPIQFLYLLHTHSCFNIPVLPNPGSHDISIPDYCSSVISVV